MKLISDRFVPHEGPEDADIMFIGDFPSADDDTLGRPFSSGVGDFLDNVLASVGLDRDSVRIGNVLNYHPAQSVFGKAQSSWQLEESRKQLSLHLEKKSHKVLVPLTNEALDFLTSQFQIDKRRGSVYEYNGMYVIPMLHPKYGMQDGSNCPAILKDMEKILRVSKEGWQAPKFKFHIMPDVYQLQGLLPQLLSAPRLYCDIESKKHTSYIRCMGFAWSETEAVCIYNDADINTGGLGPSFRTALTTLLQNKIPKTFHNGTFDTTILSANGIEVEGWDYDTMLMQHALQSELPKGLDYCTSMYTNINYYKDDGKESGDRIDRQRLAIYNCTDCVATAQVQAGQQGEMTERAAARHAYYFKQIPLAKHISQTGLFIDTVRHAELKEKLDANLKDAYTTFVGVQMMMGVEPFKATQHAKVASFLYDTLGLQAKYKKSGTGTSVTADEDAVVSLMATVQKKLEDLKTEKAKEPWTLKMAALKLLLRIRGIEKLLSSYINADASLDGRHRSWYKVGGTETDRWSASMWYDNTGLNGQTIPRESI